MRAQGKSIYTERIKRRGWTIKLPVVASCILIFFAFFLHLLTGLLSIKLYIVLLLSVTVCYLASKPIVLDRFSPIYVMWFLCLFVIGYQYVFHYRNNVVLVDLITLTCGVLLICGCSLNMDVYSGARKIIVMMAVFFAFGIYLQRILPSVYQTVLKMLPSQIYQAIWKAEGGKQTSIRGFTTNTGFAANYIITGIICTFAVIQHRKGNRKRSVAILIVLLGALLLTGKRGPLLFLLLTVIFCYVNPIRGGAKAKKIWVAFIVIMSLIVLTIVFREYLAEMPFFAKIFRTIDNLQAGEDISSGRFSLYSWAIQKFKESPITGIGWGKYRNTVVGNVTWRKSLDVHNVYLQLLCETGILGFICFVGTFIATWVMTQRCYCRNLKLKSGRLLQWRVPLYGSFAYQTYFLMYCLTGNPLYDQFYQIVYLFFCSVALAYHIVEKKETMSVKAAETEPDRSGMARRMARYKRTTDET